MPAFFRFFRLLLFGLLLLPTPLFATVHLGIDNLEARNFDQLQGKRVGLITNATGIDSQGNSTVDILLHAPNVKLVALFGPEHGVYGADYAGAYVASSIDARTGLKVYSLYGPNRKPTPEMLKDIDVLVYDIQDIGCRSYTFISTLGLAMEAAGENNVKFYVLDRPNPLNGNRVEGPMLDPKFRSFVGQWEIPYVYGLTPGELAYMIKDRGWIKKSPALTIVPMTGWTRDMYWEQTGLMWIPTSPHIPTSESALNYVATGMLGEAGGICHGIGYTLPFSVMGHPSFDSFAITDKLNGLGLSGVFFRPITFKPFYGGFKDKIVKGSEIFYRNRDKVNLTNLNLYLIYTAFHQPNIHMFQPDPSGEEGPAEFDKIAGTDTVRKSIIAGQTPEQIIASWQPGLNVYKEMRKKYLLTIYNRDKEEDKNSSAESAPKKKKKVEDSAPAPASSAPTPSEAVPEKAAVPVLNKPVEPTEPAPHSD